MKSNILIIEDVAELAKLVCLYLEKDGMKVVCAESGEMALKIVEDFSPDLVLLDLNLPGMDGFEFLHIFRKTSSVPVLIMSARDSDEDIISSLGSGADEYITKPFSPRVLVARVRAILRRIQDVSDISSQSEQIYTFGDFMLYTNSCVLTKKGERVPLSAKEFSILLYLIQNPGHPILPEKIYNTVWNNAYGDISAVAVYIQRLRKKIEEDPANPKFIETIFGMGYRFVLKGTL